MPRPLNSLKNSTGHIGVVLDKKVYAKLRGYMRSSGLGLKDAITKAIGLLK